MNPVLTATVLSLVLRTADRLGVTIPQAIVDEHADVTRVAERARSLRAELGNGTTVGDAVVAALEADADPLTDPGVQQAVVRRALLDCFHGIDQAANTRTQQFVHNHAADILAAFTQPFEDAADTITDALDVLGDVSLADTRTVADRGGAAARAWADVLAAQKVIVEVQQVWQFLAQVAPAIPWQPQYRLIIIADVPPKEWVANRLTGAQVSPWDAARRGWRLRLATPDEYRQAIAAVADELTRIQTAANNAPQKRTHDHDAA